MYIVKYEVIDNLPFLNLYFWDDMLMWDICLTIEDYDILNNYFIARIDLEERKKKDLTITREKIEYIKSFLQDNVWEWNKIKHLST